MKISTITIAAALGILTTAGSAQTEAKKEAETGAVELFNGKNLKGWRHFLVKKEVKKTDVWSVKDGVLVCKGEPLGYLQTKEPFESFRLELDWRWAPGGDQGADLSRSIPGVGPGIRHPDRSDRRPSDGDNLGRAAQQPRRDPVALGEKRRLHHRPVARRLRGAGALHAVA